MAKNVLKTCTECYSVADFVLTGSETMSGVRVPVMGQSCCQAAVEQGSLSECGCRAREQKP